jgi:hypothetical protein
MDYLDQVAFEASNFENFENAEKMVISRVGRQQAPRVLSKMMAIKAQQQAQSPEPKSKSGVGENFIGTANFSVTITRVTDNIPQDLPVPLFGVVALEERYANFLSGLLGGGTVLTSVNIGKDATNPLKAVFTFTNAGLAKVDTVELVCSSTSYASLLRATMTDVFQVLKIRYTISDITKLAQYNKQLVLATKSLFGKVQSDSLTPDTYRIPSQMQDGIVDINAQISIDKDSGIIVIMGTNGATFTVGLNMFVNHYSRRNASALSK